MDGKNPLYYNRKSGVKKRVLFLFRLWVLLAAVPLLNAADGNAALNDTVYVTNSGRRYHRDTCSSLRRSRIAVSIADALKSGYEPCSICAPPVPAASPSAADENRPGLYRLNKAELQNSEAARAERMIRAQTIDIVDGDTIRVKIPNPPAELGVVETIRLLGVDTPETVHPSRPVERFGKEAGRFTETRLLGKTVLLAFDWDLRDRYGRLLAYVYTEDGRCFNAALIREGYGFAYMDYPFKFSDEFYNLEQEAKKEKQGLWAN